MRFACTFHGVSFVSVSYSEPTDRALSKTEIVHLFCLQKFRALKHWSCHWVMLGIHIYIHLLGDGYMNWFINSYRY